MSREERFLEEIAESEQRLQQLRRDGPLSERLARAQIEDRVAFLDEKLRDIREPSLDVTLHGAGAREHTIPATILSRLLGRLQNTLTWAAHVLTLGSSVEAEPPLATRRATNLEVQALARGSFRISLQRPPSEEEMQQRLMEAGEEAFHQSVGLVLDFADAAQAGDFEAVEEKARQLGPRTGRHLHRLAVTLADSGALAQFDWAARHAELAADKARDLSRWLASVEFEERELTVRGTLFMADAADGRFGIEDTLGNRYEGRVEPELVDHAEINAFYSARIRVTVSISETLDTETERYLLLDLTREEPPPSRTQERPLL